MTELIVAMDRNNGIGKDGRLPWFCSEELKLFKKITMGKKLVVGRKTCEKLPYLPGRKVYCLTRGDPDTYDWNNNVRIINSFEEIKGEEDIMIAGGGEVYKYALNTFYNCEGRYIRKVHVSIMKEDFDCDTFFDSFFFERNYVIEKETEYKHFVHKKFIFTENGEREYLDLLDRIFMYGHMKNGRNGPTLSVFKGDLTFDLRNGFPLLTTKKMFLRGIIEEFLFFFRGSTDSSLLAEKKVNIWIGNTTSKFLEEMKLPYAEGVMGPMYGYQWRFFGAEYKIDSKGKPIKPSCSGFDQVRKLIEEIKNCPNSRRLLLTSYNPAQASEGVLYPCHTVTAQFYASSENEYLDMFCYNRSSDVGLGLPFNIASSSLLFIIIAKLTNKIARYFYLTTGDTHIYDNHHRALSIQSKRTPYKFPTLEFPNIETIEDVENLSYSDFKLNNYQSHPKIIMKMSA